MATSFFNTQKDSRLAAGSKNFSTRIATEYASLGLLQSQATQYATIDSAWQAAYAAVLVPNARNKTLVIVKNNARDAVRAAASKLARIISGQANVTDQQLSDLGLSVRATPTPSGLPGTPYDTKAELDATGALTLKWKCASPGGNVTYQIYRRTTATGEFVSLGASGMKQFVDQTIPTGTAALTYRIRAIRSMAAGAWAEFNVNFGMNGSAQTTSVEDVRPTMRKAA